MEEWKPIPSAPGYWASSEGRIRNRKGIFLVLRPNPKGYFVVPIWRHNRRRVRYVNRLVCEAFWGPPFPRADASHLDGTQANNMPDNLAWESRAVNNARKLLHGTQTRGADHGGAKVSDDDVREILRRSAVGQSTVRIAQDFPLSRWAVGDILNGRTWTHLTGLTQKKPPAVLVSGVLVRQPIHRATASV